MGIPLIVLFSNLLHLVLLYCILLMHCHHKTVSWLNLPLLLLTWANHLFGLLTKYLLNFLVPYQNRL